MSVDIAMLVSFTVYKVISLLVGLAIAYMGYRLFMAGVWGRSTDVDARVFEWRIIIKRAAPGTFFAILGAIIIGLALFKGVDYDFIPPGIPPKPALPSMQK